jgi:N-formylglutamate deformylase
MFAGEQCEVIMSQSLKPFFISIPHSGEKVPIEAAWLNGLPETLLMYDVDRYVDVLYEPVLSKLQIPFVKTDWHRYAIDLNRLADDVDLDSVEGHANPSGKFPRGLHWVITTKGERLMPKPMSKAMHDTLVEKYFEPFHRDVRAKYDQFRKLGYKTVYHLDAHSMPSVGTSEHLDPGERRADAVVSDFNGTSCSAWYRDLTIAAYEKAGFKVAVNWPYKGGRVTQTYGKPSLGQEALQVEFNRALYMDETTKKLNTHTLNEVQQKISQAVGSIFAAMPATA